MMTNETRKMGSESGIDPTFGSLVLTNNLARLGEVLIDQAVAGLLRKRQNRAGRVHARVLREERRTRHNDVRRIPDLTLLGRD